jgi:hypothetical protein
MIRTEISSYKESYKLEDWIKSKTEAGQAAKVKEGPERNDLSRKRTLYHVEGSRVVVVGDPYLPYFEEVRAEAKIKGQLQEAGIIPEQSPK